VEYSIDGGSTWTGTNLGGEVISGITQIRLRLTHEMNTGSQDMFAIGSLISGEIVCGTANTLTGGNYILNSNLSATYTYEQGPGCPI
jgi:hypothetical protein